MALDEKKATEILYNETATTETTPVVEETVIEDLTPGQTKVGAVARLLVLLVAIINQLLTILGVYTLPAVSEDVMQLVSLVLVAAAAGYAYWKNNSWTPEAKVGDNIMAALKAGDLNITDILTIITKVSGNKKL